MTKLAAPCRTTRLVSAADAARRLNVTEADVLAMLLDGRLTGSVMRGRRLIDLDSINRLPKHRDGGAE